MTDKNDIHWCIKPSPRKLLLVLIYSLTQVYYEGVFKYNIKKCYDRQLDILELNESYKIDEHGMFDFIENLKDLILVDIKKDDDGHYDVLTLTKYGKVLASYILQKDFGYIKRNLILNQVDDI